MTLPAGAISSCHNEQLTKAFFLLCSRSILSTTTELMNAHTPKEGAKESSPSLCQEVFFFFLKDLSSILDKIVSSII